MKKMMYLLINLITVCIGIYAISHLYYLDMNYLDNIKKLKIWILLLTIVLILFVQIIKGLRFYLIILENKILMVRFVRVYLKTTFVNLSLPFKIGEIFKVYCYGNEMKNYKLSFLSIIVDRYFDTIPLLIIVLGYCFFKNQKIPLLMLFLSAFIVFITLAYITFLPTYRYINRFIIVNIESADSIKYLKFIQKLYSGYNYISELVQDRFSLLLIISFFSWGLEYFVLFMISYGLKNIFSNAIFVQYLNSVLLGNPDTLATIYIGTTTILFAFLFIGTYGVSTIIKWRKR